MSERQSPLTLLFGVEGRIARKRYVIAGGTLAALKYGLDTAILYAATGETWTPRPGLASRMAVLGSGDEWALATLLALSLVFMWIGLSMSLRRAVDAGRSPLLALLFLVPIANYVMMLILAASRAARRS
ncbi:MAG TPA: DUF805 domain-containing protein [Nannocystis sp.]